MCGRYERHSDKQNIADAFKVGKPRKSILAKP